MQILVGKGLKLNLVKTGLAATASEAHALLSSLDLGMKWEQ